MRTSTTLLTFLLLGLFGCSDTKDYKIKFDNVDWLRVSDQVIYRGLVVGEVTKIKVDTDTKILVSVNLRDDFKITKDSKFIIKPRLIGERYIDIILSDNKDLLDQAQIQIGQVAPRDTVIKKYSKEQLDSLLKYDPNYKLADTIIKVLGTIKKNSDQTKK
jgi:ABC-type transporter Mla subunit MlaD